LDLSSNHFNVEGYFRLLTALKSTNQTPLKKLNLSRNNLGFDEENQMIPHYFAVTEVFINQNRSIEELNLNDCKLGPDGAAILGKSMRRNQRITKLHLASNRFEDKGINYILEGVLDNIQTTAQMSGAQIVVAPI
jgi:Leucine Rich repeat